MATSCNCAAEAPTAASAISRTSHCPPQGQTTATPPQYTSSTCAAAVGPWSCQPHAVGFRCHSWLLRVSVFHAHSRMSANTVNWPLPSKHSAAACSMPAWGRPRALRASGMRVASTDRQAASQTRPCERFSAIWHSSSHARVDDLLSGRPFDLLRLTLESRSASSLPAVSGPTVATRSTSAVEALLSRSVVYRRCVIPGPTATPTRIRTPCGDARAPAPVPTSHDPGGASADGRTRRASLDVPSPRNRRGDALPSRTAGARAAWHT